MIVGSFLGGYKMKNQDAREGKPRKNCSCSCKQELKEKSRNRSRQERTEEPGENNERKKRFISSQRKKLIALCFWKFEGKTEKSRTRQEDSEINNQARRQQNQEQGGKQRTMSRKSEKKTRELPLSQQERSTAPGDQAPAFDQ